MSDVDKDQWEVIGSVPANDGGPKRHVVLSKDGARFGLLFERYGTWNFKGGPWTYETMLRCAENIVAGDKRAITWPDAQLCLAAGYLAIICEAERRRSPQPASCDDGDRTSPAFAREAQPPAATSMPPDAPPPARCDECGT